MDILYPCNCTQLNQVNGPDIIAHLPTCPAYHFGWENHSHGGLNEGKPSIGGAIHQDIETTRD